MLEFSAWAIEILRRADAAARRLNPDARVRLTKAAAPTGELRAQTPQGALTTELVDAPAGTDQIIELEGTTFYVEQGVEGLIDVEEPHDRIVLKPKGSPHNAH